ncbi:MAG: serine/threonine protein kinase [Bacteroidia bacterium]|nr:MAG: serine/threonine protein kinase [Bacteroidia bacterium]
MEQALISGYKLQYKLSEGGMSEIWYAQNALLKSAAVKVLKQELIHHEKANRIFENESFVLAQLQHPYIRQVIDVGRVDHRPAIVLEYLEGKTLGEYFKENKHFDQEQLIAWWNEAVDILQYIHRKNIIHNDITPANFFITEDRRLHLIDFGLAIMEGKVNISADGYQRIGSVRYLSPEVLNTPENLKASADAYSLAASFYQLVSGKKPYAETVEMSELQGKIQHEIIPAFELDAPWSFLLEGYLYKNAESRNSLHKIDINKAIEDDQTLEFTVVQEPQVSPIQAVYTPEFEKKKSGNWFWTFFVIMIITALIVFAANEEKFMPYIQKWMGTQEPPKLEAKAETEKPTRPQRRPQKESNPLPTPQPILTDSADEQDTNIKIIDIAQKEFEVKTLMNEYYHSRDNCDRMSEFFAPVVKQYYTKSNLSIDEVMQECNQYHSKWKFVEAEITPSSYVYKHQNNGKTFVDFNVLYNKKKIVF